MSVNAELGRETQNHWILVSLYKLSPAHYWVQRKGKKLIQGHTDGWFPSPPSFLFITEQSRNWASGSLYFQKQKCMYICKVTQKKGLGTPTWWKLSPIQAGGGATLLLHGLVHTCAYILELLSHMWHQFWVWGEDLPCLPKQYISPMFPANGSYISQAIFGSSAPTRLQYLS